MCNRKKSSVTLDPIFTAQCIMMNLISQNNENYRNEFVQFFTHYTGNSTATVHLK